MPVTVIFPKVASFLETPNIPRSALLNMGAHIKCVTDVTKKDIAKIQSTLFEISPQTIGR